MSIYEYNEEYAKKANFEAGEEAGYVKGEEAGVNTDNLVHTARCFSARIPEVECILSAT